MQIANSCIFAMIVFLKTICTTDIRAELYYSKKVLHHLIFTKFLSNVLCKYTKHFFLNIILPWSVGHIV